jgi:hypothetical protein
MLVGPLTDPERHGGNAEDAFDVVIPMSTRLGKSWWPAKPISNGDLEPAAVLAVTSNVNSSQPQP